LFRLTSAKQIAVAYKKPRRTSHKTRPDDGANDKTAHHQGAPYRQETENTNA
jgi:hypothetical protein